MKEFRFGAVYGAPPIFNSDLEQMGYIDPSELNLPDSLCKAINTWTQEFQETFCEDYPPESGFDSLEKRTLHNSRGRELALLLQKTLGDDTLVRFIPLK